MPSYSYVAVDGAGKQKKGVLEAPSIDAAKAALKNDGLIPVSVELPSAFNKEINLDIGGKVKPKDLAIFCKQFQSIMHAGVTVIEALGMLAGQTENKKLREATDEVRLLVEKGDTLAGAMASRDDVFPKILIHMMEAGEASGSMETSLERMAVHFEKDSRLKSMVVQAMIYPVVLLIVIVCVVALMLIKIVPSFQETFEQAGGELPMITQIVVGLSNFMIAYWPVFLGAIIGIALLFRFAKQTEAGAMTIGRITMKMPLFGDLTIKTASARLTRTLSTLMASGIPMVSAIEICAKIMSNRVIQVVLEEAKKDVEQGIPLSRPLEKSEVFPPLLCQMTKIGEETGNMEDMLEKVADIYDEEVETATKAITTVLEPMIIIVMAAVVVPIMLAIMMPMMSVYSMAENS